MTPAKRYEVAATVEAAVIELPEHAGCGVCGGAGELGGTGACPQCNGVGHMPFPPMPQCGHDGCRSGAMVLMGHSKGDERLPIYVCGAGHHTAVRYREPGA